MIVRGRVTALAVMLTAASFTASAAPETPTTWTGWFSDKGCAESKVKSGDIRPNNTECVKRCLADGAVPVFLSEQAKAMYQVKNHPTVAEDVGYHVEVTGIVDEAAQTIAVRSVKRLSQVVQTCALPKRTTK